MDTARALFVFRRCASFLVGQSVAQTSWGCGSAFVVRPIADEENRLRKAIHNGVTVASYWYDAAGNRVRSDESGTVIYYTYDGLNIIQEHNTTTGVCTDYIFAGSTRIAENTGGVVRYYHGDHLGSTRVATDTAGAKVAEYKYAAYGSTISQTGSFSTDYKFTGKPEDSVTGLYYFGARYYSPTLGRFITQDPARDGANWYEYCRSNPLGFVDTDGRSITAAAGTAGVKWLISFVAAYAAYEVANDVDWDSVAGSLTAPRTSARTQDTDDAVPVPIPIDLARLQDRPERITIYHYGYLEYLKSYMACMRAYTYYTGTPTLTAEEAVNLLALDLSTKGSRPPDVVMAVSMPTTYYDALRSAGQIEGLRWVEPRLWPNQPYHPGGGMEMLVKVPLYQGVNGVLIYPYGPVAK